MDAIDIIIELEWRGFALSAAGETLYVHCADESQIADLAEAIRENKPEILRILIEDKVRKVIKMYPLLTPSGILSQRERQRILRNYPNTNESMFLADELLQPYCIDEIKVCLDFFKHIEKTKTTRDNPGIKTLIEKWSKTYVCAGSVFVAAGISGFTPGEKGGWNMSRLSLRKICKGVPGCDGMFGWGGRYGQIAR